MLFTYDNLWTLLALLGFCVGLIFLLILNRRFSVSFAWRMILALAVGIVFGIVLQAIFGSGTQSTAGKLIKQWIAIVGDGFVHALQLLVVPLVLVSIVKSISQFVDPTQGAKSAAKLILFLLVTTAISCVITIIIVRIYGLQASKLIKPTPTPRQPISVAATLLAMVPTNLLAALSQNKVLSIVFIAVLIGAANLGIKQKHPATSAGFERALEIARAFVMELVRLVISFTPYGVLATVTNTAAGGDVESVKQLGLVIAGAYTSLALIFVLHMVIVLVLRVSPITFVKAAAGPLLFAFGSRSSSACLPLTIRAMQQLGVPESTANLAGTFGTCIGQNACSGMQPPMLVILVAQVQQVEVWEATFLIELVIYVVIASIGTAGVGGGATNVSIMVLSMFSLPINLVAVLIGVDFVIDMGRTLVNVSDSIVAGLFVARLEKTLNEEILAGRMVWGEEVSSEPLLQGVPSEVEIRSSPVCDLGGSCSLAI
jgi:L-cystine uptake protein TcyP (sodium:dicarboxylate symporter family)